MHAGFVIGRIFGAAVVASDDEDLGEQSWGSSHKKEWSEPETTYESKSAGPGL